ncbi:unnamed protein product [Rotaria sp. Silwood1]|nr:unnamed protein product [Rotaria sp. Silwood1]
MDSDSDETYSDENESSISSDGLESSDSEDNDSLIEELNQSSMDDWEWKVDNSSFSTSFNYFDGHALGNNIIRPTDSFFKFISQDLIKLITDQTNIYGKQRCVQKGEDATSWKEVDENLIHAFLEPRHAGAGFWGDYRNCDIPLWTVQTILQYASELEDFDFIYYTGDLPPHNVWNQSRADQLYTIQTINQLLAKTFPNKTFYPAVGNHEAAPCNLFPTPIIRSDNISWLYEALADSWLTLGLPSDTRDTITRGAFYTTIVRPGLRLISLNMNYCAPENYWLFVNATDPLDQLQWFIQWLQYAEDHDEKVHILGHHPPRSCLAAFSWNFHKIINRYEIPLLAYVTPSMTTQSFLNPGYRVYTMDGVYPNSSYWVLDHRTVIMNLTASNMYNRSILINEYEARDAYEMENLFPADWDNLIQRMKNDIDGPLMGLAYTYYTKSYATGTSCNHDCRRGLLCNFMTGRSDDPHACDSIPTYR